MAKDLKNLLVNKIHDKQLLLFASKYISGRLIDIGCGVKPYVKLVEPFVSEHIGLDHQDTFHEKDDINLFGTAYAIPSKDEQFDSAMCTAVLEHLEEPEAALRECYRVLKPGGVGIYSVPFIWHLHEEPRDFFRFSKYGLAYLFDKVGFEIVELKALSGFWVTFGQLFVYNIYRMNRGFLRTLKVIDLIGLLVQGIAFSLDKVDKTEQWTWMYMVVVRKAGTVEGEVPKNQDVLSADRER